MLFLSALFASSSAQAGPRTFSLLNQSRDNVTFVPYTAEQRVQVAQAVDNLMSVYVNRESKLDYYGKVKTDIDPIPRVKAIKEKAATMSDKDLHYAFAEVFLSLRDFQYYFINLAPITKCPPINRF